MNSPERMLAKALLLYAKERGARFLRNHGNRIMERAGRLAEHTAYEAGRLKAQFDRAVEDYKKKKP